MGPPPLAAKGATSNACCLPAEFSEDVIEHGFTVEEHKVSPDLLHRDCRPPDDPIYLGYASPDRTPAADPRFHPRAH